MATWHQMRAHKRNPVRLYHATKWTVVEDPPGGMRTSILFATEAEAIAYVQQRAALGTAAHLQVLKPANISVSA